MRRKNLLHYNQQEIVMKLQKRYLMHLPTLFEKILRELQDRGWHDNYNNKIIVFNYNKKKRKNNKTYLSGQAVKSE